jgi:hypothetical protein
MNHPVVLQRPRHPLDYYQPVHYRLMGEARSFEVLLPIALDVIRSLPDKATMICGPMTTGGLGNMRANMRRFAIVTDLYAAREPNLFTQLPFEGAMDRIKASTYYRGVDHLLESFYGELFASGCIRRLCFLPDWESSYGARWEYERARELDLDVRHFGPQFFLEQNPTMIVD